MRIHYMVEKPKSWVEISIEQNRITMIIVLFQTHYRLIQSSLFLIHPNIDRLIRRVYHDQPLIWFPVIYSKV